MSFNSLAAASVLNMPLQDNAANTDVANYAAGGSDSTLVGGDNTEDIATTGPGGGLASALAFDGTADYVNATGAADLGITDSATVLLHVNLASITNNAIVVIAGDSNVDVESGAGFYIRQKSGAWQFLVGTGGSFSAANSATSLATATWVKLLATVSPNDQKIYVDSATAEATATPATVNLGKASEPIRLGGTAGSFSNCLIAGMLLFDTDQSGNAAELLAGPELQYQSGASIDSSGNYDVGTWALPTPYSGNNGTPTYEVTAATADGTTIDTATATSGTLDLSSASGLVYLYVRATNDGGNDVGDNATRSGSFGSSGDGYYEVASVVVDAALLPVSDCRRGLLTAAGNIKPGLVNSTYTSGDGTADNLKPSLLTPEGTLKPGWLNSDGTRKSSNKAAT